MAATGSSCAWSRAGPCGGASGERGAVLAAALSSFGYVEVVVTGGTSADGGADGGLLASLWRAAEPVTASSEEVAAFLRSRRAPGGRGLRPLRGSGASVGHAFPAGTVPPLEHGELLLRVRARRLLGALARKLLGRRAPAVRASIWRLARLARLGPGDRGGRQERADRRGPGGPQSPAGT